MCVLINLANSNGSLAHLPRFVAWNSDGSLAYLSSYDYVLIFRFSSWQAVMNGFWVVLEDIDKAPSDVPLVLSPLLGGSCSFVTSHGEVNTFFLLLTNFFICNITVGRTLFVILCFRFLSFSSKMYSIFLQVIRIAESFQLFSTISTPECSVSLIREGISCSH